MQKLADRKGSSSGRENWTISACPVNTSKNNQKVTTERDNYHVVVCVCVRMDYVCWNMPRSRLFVIIDIADDGVVLFCMFGTVKNK